MSTLRVAANVERAELRAVVTRADGTVEDLGVIATTEQPAQPQKETEDDGQNAE